MKRLSISAILAIFLLLIWASCAAQPPPPTPTPAPLAPPPTEGELRGHFIDIGQGDSILLDCGETEILIDGGDKSPGVVGYLNNYVDGALEVMVATHPHADHIGGLIAVLDAFEVEEIWLNGDTSTSKTYQDFMSLVNTEGASVYEAERGNSIEVGVLSFLILHPVRPLVDDTNNNSIVFRLSYGNVDFLFTGDAEQEAEASILESGLTVQADILKVGHHCSRTASSAQFLDAVKPQVAIYMAGEGNRYGHPHKEALSALTQAGAMIYGTDINGTIIVTTDGEAYTLQPGKQAAPHASPAVSSTANSAGEVPPIPASWDWRQILVTVALTILGSVFIAYTTLHLQDKITRKRLLKALLAEVRHNVVVTRGQTEWIAKLQGVYAPAGLKQLHTASYYAVKERGILADVPEAVRERIFRVYDIIYGIHSGRFDLNLQQEVVSPSSFTPGAQPISDLLKDLPELESNLAAFLGVKH